jgi:hypothetical protein
MRRTKQRLFPGAGGCQSPLASLFLQPKELRVMGYRSDVWVGLLVQNEEDAMELLKVYSAMPKVKENKILELWQIEGDPTTGRVLFLYEADYVKWYDSYEDVQAIKEIRDAAIKADIEYAYREIEFGEDFEDLKDRMDADDEKGFLTEEMWDLFSLSRCCDVNNGRYEDNPTLDTYKMFAA